MTPERTTRAPRPANRQQRLVALAQHVLEAGAVPMQQLADVFGVSRMTVYRDVADLERAGVLHVKNGVAVAVVSSFTETTHTFRTALHQDAKRSLCQAVRGRIRPGSTVFLDDSSTVLPLVAMLAEQAPMTIITHSQALAVEAAQYPELRLFVTGGTYRPAYDSYAGETTLATLRHLSADFCVMSSTAIHDATLYHPVEENAAVKRAMVERARTSILLADATKFGHRATHKVCWVNDFDLLAITGEIPAGELAGIEIEIVTV